MDDQELLKDVFSSIDASVPPLVFVNSGRQLLNFLEEHKNDHLPCLVVLDYNMPELNGAEILKELKKSDRFDKIPKIIWSTSRTDSYKMLCLSLGASDYVIKPSTIEDLKEVAKYMLSLCPAWALNLFKHSIQFAQRNGFFPYHDVWRRMIDIGLLAIGTHQVDPELGKILHNAIEVVPTLSVGKVIIQK